jgi:hypothetical protein
VKGWTIRFDRWPATACSWCTTSIKTVIVLQTRWTMSYLGPLTKAAQAHVGRKQPSASGVGLSPTPDTADL